MAASVLMMTARVSVSWAVTSIRSNFIRSTTPGSRSVRWPSWSTLRPSSSRTITTDELSSVLQEPSLLEWSPSLSSTSTSKILDVRDPASPSTILARIPISSDPQSTAARKIEQCYERLTTGGWRDKTTASHRGRLLQSWSKLMEEHCDDLATICTLESGKPLRESVAEVNYARSFLDYYAHEALRPTSAGGGMMIPTPFATSAAAEPRGHIMAVQQAVGVSALICPWNFPLAMITRKVGPALAAGCTAVVKPSELTPLSAIALYNLASRAGIDAGVFELVLADAETTPDVGTIFCTHPLVKKISFTGSTHVGKLLLQQASGTVKRTSMELGGNACFVVFDDADIDVAVNAAMASKFRNSGQTCVASDRFLIQRGVYDLFIEKIQRRIDNLKVGAGIDPSTDIGPLITSKAVDTVEQKVQDAIAHGANCISRGCGLQQAQEIGPLFSPPTLITDVPVDCSLWKDETFGPVIAARCFDSDDEALAIANHVDVGLASYFCTRELRRAFRFAHQLEVGMVGVNEGIISNCVAPFGGVKESGIGREGSPLGISEFLETKYIFMNT